MEFICLDIFRYKYYNGYKIFDFNTSIAFK
jgi:hypothetical protein